MGSDAEYLAEDDQGAAEEGDVSTTEEIRERADKRAHGGKGDEVCRVEPVLLVCAADGCVDDVLYASC